MKPIVAIVGRPNVGKSTLFNRLIGRRKAVVADEPGVTRDLNYGDVEETGRSFTLVDTGGFEPAAEDGILRQVREQASLAMEEADVIIFLLDGRAGLTPQDRELASMLRKVEKPVVYAVNKIDAQGLEAEAAEFYALGVPDVLPVSAEQGRGLADLMDAVVAKLPPAEEAGEEDDRVKVAIVGRPNVGKSSMLNRLIGRQRSIVSDVAGTTRDSIDTPFDLDGQRFLFIDTAGIRKKNRVSLRIEIYCVMEAIRSIERCDVAALVLDGGAGVQGQDEKIAGLIEERKKCCVIIVNKWDLVEKDTHTMKHATEAIRRKLPFLTYAPVLFTSALTGQRLPKVLDTVVEVFEKGKQRVQTSVLNRVVEGLYLKHRPPVHRGKEVKFYYAAQTGVSPPEFIIFTNFPEGVVESYKRYIVNGLRDSLGMETVPIKVYFRQRH
ncbi:MAG: ribosome biogenesis GTPase Der [Deltaproteobacteria bacterium]|nr:ribosome biogenesis GTPase Der [Deltaproteobacteria bacterium]